MKKILYVAIAASLINSTAAFSQVKFAINGGTSIANIFSKEEGNTTKLKNRTGYTAGIGVEIPAGSHISIQTGLNYVQKGTREKTKFFDLDYKYSLDLDYIEVPVNIVYNTNSGSGSNFFIGAGPSLSYGISGKYSIELGPKKEGEKLHFGNKEEDIKPIDAGANAIAGYRFSNGIFMAVNYNRGLTNLYKNPDPDYNERVTTQYFGIRLGYQFGNRK